MLGQVAPEPDGSGGITGYVGAVTDMTELRRLEREVLEISEREQQRIGQDLHDDLCQHLVGIQYAAASLRRSLLSAEPRTSVAASEMVELLKDAVIRTRQMARQIFPINLDEAGLMAALHGLAENSSRLFDISCRFRCSSPVLLEDQVIAAHIYRISQEALSNAIRHGQATEVEIALASENHRMTLTIRDNGVGFPVPAPDSTGMGLHIMHYRARMIGAALSVGPHPDGGTVVSCVLRQSGKRLRELVESAETELSSHAS